MGIGGFIRTKVYKLKMFTLKRGDSGVGLVDVELYECSSGGGKGVE